MVNIDDARGRELAARAQIPVTTFSAAGRQDADWRAVDVRCGADGSSFRVIGPGGIEADATIPLAGLFNVANALGAVVALVEAGAGLQHAVAGVAACRGVPGRLERVDPGDGQDFTILVDYSHKPGAVEAVLRALRPVTEGKLTIVLGCGGDRDRAKRPLMGAAAASLADVAILTSDNPRSEDPLAILMAMLEGAAAVRPPRSRARDRRAGPGGRDQPGGGRRGQGRCRAGGRQGARAGTVHRRDGDPVRRPRGGGRGGGRQGGGRAPRDRNGVQRVIPLSLAQIAEITGATLDRAPDPHALVTGPVVIDSREAKPGGLFAALPGERVDGHDFAGAAVAAGAVAVLASRPVGVPALVVPDVQAALALLARAVIDRLPGLTIAGITGSSGKTTTKDLLAQVAERLGPTVAPAGSFNNELGHPLTVLRADERTRYLVLELGARGRGHIARLCAIAPPRLGAVLNVGRAHVGGYFADQAEVAQAKGELVEALPADGVAVLNADDSAVMAG